MNSPTVSVVVVSRDRPDTLRLCLLGLEQLYYPAFEIVVVANEASRGGIPEHLHDSIRFRTFEDANISAARNLGVAASGGEIVAFIDDDAVPEPTWLDHLVGPFAQSEVAAAGGFVRGRNGISFQWKARMAFPDGRAVDMPIEGWDPVIPLSEPGRAVKTEGTNMAVRRSVLCDLGGFDEAFRFYADETDLNMRLAASGQKTAVVPRAQVVHGYAASPRRTEGRVPRDLTDIGRSLCIFVRKHGAELEPAHLTHRRLQRHRLVSFMRDGDLMPGDVRRLMRGFEAGWNAGLGADFGKAISFDSIGSFKPMPARFEGHEMRVLSGRFWQASSILKEAQQIVDGENRCTVHLYSFSALFHRIHFEEPGIWVQRGGQFGKSDRSDPLVRFYLSQHRVRRENARLAGIRTKNAAQLAESSQENGN